LTDCSGIRPHIPPNVQKTRTLWAARPQEKETVLAPTKEQLLGAIDEALRTMPLPQAFGYPNDDTLAWLGRASALIQEWSAGAGGAPLQVSSSTTAADTICSNRNSIAIQAATNTIRRVLNEARADLQLRTVGPMTAAFEAGKVFDYFDEVRKIIEPAASDVLFVDPYLDADFVARYLPHVRVGTPVRLLTRERLSALFLPSTHWRASRGWQSASDRPADFTIATFSLTALPAITLARRSKMVRLSHQRH
jgi:hypothetical protein